MAENLPEPESRKEAYLAKAAGVSVEELPTPASREELYLNAIANGGGGGGTSDFEDLTNRPKYNGVTMTGSTDIPLAPTVVQTTGTSTTNVMSQDAATKMVFEGANEYRIKIGNGASTNSDRAVGIGRNATASGRDSVAIGKQTTAYGTNSIALGETAQASRYGAIALGYCADAFAYGSIAIGGRSGDTDSAVVSSDYDGGIAIGVGARPSAAGEMNIGDRTATYGYNNSAYRLLTGLYDPQSAHDAATKGYVDGLVGNIESALNAVNNGGGN